MKISSTISGILFRLTPFWLFLVLFKLAAGLHYTLLAPFGAQVFPVWLVGTLIGGAAFVQLCLDVPSGYLTDRFGYKRMLAVTTFFFMVAAGCFLLGLNKATFLISLMVSILGWQFFSPGINAYIMGQANRQTIGRLMSSKEVFASIGIVCSSIVIIFAVSWKPAVVGIALVAGFVAALTALLAAPNDRTPEIEHHAAHGKKAHPGFWKEAFQAAHRLRPASYLLMVTGFTASTFYAIIWFVVPLLIAEQVNSGILGLGLGIFDFSVVVLGFVIGKVVDSFNRKLLIFVGMLVFAVAGMLLASNFGFLFLLLGFIATAGDELAELSLWAWMYSTEGDSRHYGLITGITEVWSDLGWAVGPVLAGFLYTFVGPAWSIAIGGMIAMVNIVAYMIMIGRPLPSVLKPVPGHHVKRVKHKN